MSGQQQRNSDETQMNSTAITRDLFVSDCTHHCQTETKKPAGNYPIRSNQVTTECHQRGNKEAKKGKQDKNRKRNQTNKTNIV